jgi:hypothetical protein
MMGWIDGYAPHGLTVIAALPWYKVWWNKITRRDNKFYGHRVLDK